MKMTVTTYAICVILKGKWPLLCFSTNNLLVRGRIKSGFA